ncbi:MAG: hypothetical protein K2W95_25565 [Candidatus Obscuribacterales bacterium]|nr:hypothetical protein [Candidatus Obscuribacterales bacterium]
MTNLLSVRDASGRHMVVFSLDDSVTRQPAIDIVFDIIGNPDPQKLAEIGTLAEGQVEDFLAIQRIVFDKDDQGLFIRDNVSFAANGSDLDPDAPMTGAFVAATKGDIVYRRCDLVISGPAGSENFAPSDSGTSTGQQGSIPELARLMFLHQVAKGAQIDVTKDLPELQDILSKLEKDGLIDIDVKKAAYKLTDKGIRTHASYLEEAQNLIRRYDIFGDVDIDASGKAHFDTGLGKDLRVPVYEVEGIDPYRARFLLGLNDGEWDGTEDWIDNLENEDWYRQVFEPIDRAPSVDDVGGKARIEAVLDQGKSVLRSMN